MTCQIRLADGVRASAPRRLPDRRSAPRRNDVHDARRRANDHRSAGRGAVACRIAWPDFAAGDAPASERES